MFLKEKFPNIPIIVSGSKKYEYEVRKDIKDMADIIYEAQKEILLFHPDFK